MYFKVIINYSANRNISRLGLTLGKDDDLIIDLLSIPELHLHLGIVNRLLQHLNSKYPHVYEWCERNNIYVQTFRGISLNGNSCKFALNFLDDLEKEVPLEYKNIVTALKAFDVVRLWFAHTFSPKSIWFLPLLLKKFNLFNFWLISWHLL